MKKIIYTFAFLLLTSISYSQSCTRSVNSWVKANGGYNINGKATFSNDNGKLTISLDQNFSTVSGPDLHLYLSKLNTSPAEAGNTNVVISLLKSNTGAQSFDVPQGVKISDYEYVLIHCLAGNHLWGGGQLSAINGTCPSVAGIDDEKISPSVHYIQESNLVKIKNMNQTADAIIYNLLGNKVFEGEVSESIKLNPLPKGIYILKLKLADSSNYSFKINID